MDYEPGEILRDQHTEAGYPNNIVPDGNGYKSNLKATALVGGAAVTGIFGTESRR